MDGWVDNTHEDALTHTVHLADPDRAVEVSVVALPSPTYAIREARCRALAGDLDPGVAAGFPRLAGSAMVGAWACWQIDTTAWIDLPDSCFTYSEAGRALFATRPVTSPMVPELYSPRPGQRRVFVRRKVARLERADGILRLFHSMHDDAHGFELTYEIDAATGRVLRAESVTPKLPYQGICSEPQRKIHALVGETVDDGLRKRIQAHVGGVSGCAQLYDLTSDLLKLLYARKS